MSREHRLKFALFMKEVYVILVIDRKSVLCEFTTFLL